MVVSLLILPCGGLDIFLCSNHVLNAVVVSFQFVVGSPAVHPCFGCIMVSKLSLYIPDSYSSSAGVVSVHWCVTRSEVFSFVTFAMAFYDLQGL